MKITYSNGIPTPRFEDIPVGGCFIDDDGEICMKIYTDEGDGAICFGEKRVYPGDAFSRIIKPVEVELIVHAEER